MRIYRITKTRYVATAWSGLGAAEYGGRWNSKGRRVIYGAASISLALLEILAHIDDARGLSGYSLFSIDIPDEQIAFLADEDLPLDWRSLPAPSSTALIGDEWTAENVSMALSVPSTVVPQERNFLINPAYDAFEQTLTSVVELPLDFDPRLNSMRA